MRACVSALCRDDCALLSCDVLAVDARQHARIIRMKKATKTKKNVEEGSFSKKNENGKDSPASNRRKRCSGGSSERSEKWQWSPLRKKEKDKVKKVYTSKYLVQHNSMWYTR